jgi:hypothetical protein
MATKDEVEAFLEELRVKEASGILTLLILDDRSKNAQSLHTLDIPPDKRKDIIRKLKPEDFYRIEEGKYMEKYLMWSFGKIVQTAEVYIKISLTERNVICISFHEAEYPIVYPFKS